MSEFTAWMVILSLYLASGIECPNANAQEMCRMINKSEKREPTKIISFQISLEFVSLEPLQLSQSLPQNRYKSLPQKHI